MASQVLKFESRVFISQPPCRPPGCPRCDNVCCTGVSPLANTATAGTPADAPARALPTGVRTLTAAYHEEADALLDDVRLAARAVLYVGVLPAATVRRAPFCARFTKPGHQSLWWSGSPLGLRVIRSGWPRRRGR